MSPLPSSSPSKSSRNSSCCPRAPLQEMPLELFLLPPNSSKFGTSTKRPVSPGTSVLYSPAKRRILNQEGLCSLTMKASASTVPTTSSQNKASQHQRFTDALMGPDSPARKLDFGTPKNALGNKAPVRVAVDEKLGIPPEVKVGMRPCLRNHEIAEDRPSISRSTSQSQPQPQSLVNHASLTSWSQPPRHLDFLPAPRDVPPPVDPQSEHYPGFVVYQDPYILIPTLRLTSSALSPASSAALAPLDEELDDISDAEFIGSREQEFVKENLPPRRKAHKLSAGSISELFPPSCTPSCTKLSSVPATPLREHSLKEENLTARKSTIARLGAGTGFRKAQYFPSKEDQSSMRRILKEEVNGEQGDD